MSTYYPDRLLRTLRNHIPIDRLISVCPLNPNRSKFY